MSGCTGCGKDIPANLLVLEKSIPKTKVERWETGYLHWKECGCGPIEKANWASELLKLADELLKEL